MHNNGTQRSLQQTYNNVLELQVGYVGYTLHNISAASFYYFSNRLIETDNWLIETILRVANILRTEQGLTPQDVLYSSYRKYEKHDIEEIL